MMRVLHVPTVDWQPTEGIARACRELAAELSDCASYLAVDTDPGASGAVFAGVHVIPGWAPSTPWRSEFARRCDELRPDVVHLHGGELAPLLAFAPALRDLPVVVTAYSPAAQRGPRGARSRVEHRANVSPVRATLAGAGGVALARRALRTGRVRVLCTPDARVEANFEDCGPVLRACGGGRLSRQRAVWSTEPIVVFAGRAQTGRGVDDLIEAFAAVRRVHPRARLRLLLLPGGAAERWRARLAAAPWAEVRIGGIDRLEDALAQCQVGAFPFRWSNTLTPALAAAEAMAVGLPVVATAVECLTPLVESGVNGVLVPPEDPRALGAAIADVLRAPETWAQFARGARKTIEGRWSWAAAAETTREAYELAVRDRSRA